MKKKIVGIIILLLVILAVIGTLYLTTDLFRTPEQLFYQHLINDLLGEMSYEEMMVNIQNGKTLSMETEGEITGKITSNDESMKELSTILEKAKITYNTKMIGLEQKTQNDIKLTSNDNSVIALKLLKNKEQYGIKIDEFHNQYISVENNNLKSVFQKLGMDTSEIPDKFTELDYYEFLNIDEETLNHIKATYYNVLKENIPVESYSIEKNVAIKIDNNNITTNAYKLTLTEDQVNTITIKMLETLKNDEKTLDLIIEKNKMLENSFISINEEELTKDILIKEIEEKIAQINENDKENKVLNIAIYGAKNGKAKMNIIESIEDKEVSKTEIDIVKSEDGSKKLIISGIEEDVIADIVLSYNETETDLIMKIGDEELMIELNIKEVIKATENITIEEFDSSNSVKLNDMTEAEIEQLIGKIYLNVLYTLPQKIQLLGIDFSGSTNMVENNAIL